MYEKIAVISVLAGILLCATPAFAQTAYDDVSVDHWSYAALDYMQAIGVLEGYPDGFFNKGRTLTRFDFAQAVWRLDNDISWDTSKHPAHVIALETDLECEFAETLWYIKTSLSVHGSNIPDTAASPFETEHPARSAYLEVPLDYWAYSAWEELAAREYLHGTKYGEVDQAEVHTRGWFTDMTQLAVARAFQENDPDVNDIHDRLYFEFRDCLRLCSVTSNQYTPFDPYTGQTEANSSANDYVSINSWSYDALSYIQAMGALEGYPEGYISGERVLTRYEFAQATARLASDIEVQQDMYPTHITALVMDLVSEYSDQLLELERRLRETAELVADFDSVFYMGNRGREVQLDEWAYTAWSQLNERGYLHDSEFSQIKPGEVCKSGWFADMTQLAVARAFQDNDPEVNDILDRLYFTFRDCLRLCAVATTQRTPGELEFAQAGTIVGAHE